MKYMVDTNIINWPIDGSMSTDDFPKDAAFVATHIQHDELSKTRDSERKQSLLDQFNLLFGQLKSALDSLNHCKSNNSEDALIAEAAIVNGYTLITADEDLHNIAENYGCDVAPVTKLISN